MANAPALPLDVHQMLEEEYVSMYGALPPDEKRKDVDPEKYIADDILNASQVAAALRRWNVRPAGRKDEKQTVADALNALIAVTGIAGNEAAKNPRLLLHACNTLSGATTQLMQDYASYAEPERRLINRRILDENFSDSVRSLRDARLQFLYKQLHARAAKDDGRTALCISGGGIRSATFALGIIQGLSTIGLLKRFDYLSTVSGGGYIGSWLSSWVRRHPDGIEGVEKDLADRPTEIVQKLEPEPKPVRHLRQYSNYLSPQLGLLSADAWTMAALYMRNLLLNWLVLVPLFAAALAAPRVLAWLQHGLTAAHLPAIQRVGMAALVIGFGYLGFSRPVKHGRVAERGLMWFSRLSANMRFLLFCVIPLTIGAGAMALFWALVQKHPLTADQWWAIAGRAFLVMTLLPGAIYFIRFWWTPFSLRRESARSGWQTAKRLMLEAAATIASGAVGIGLLLLFAKKVFDLPNATLPQLDKMLPFERPVLWLDAEAELYTCLAVPLILLTFFIQASIFVGVAGRKNQDYDREWWGRAGAWLLIVAAVFGVVSLISIFGPLVIYDAPALVASIGGLSGVIALVLGRSGKTPANAKQKEQSGMAGTASNVALGFAVPVFVAALLATLSVGTTFLVQELTTPVEHPVSRWERAAKFNSTTTEKTTAGPQTVENKTAAEPLISVATMKGLAHLETVRNTSRRDVEMFAAFVAVGLFFSLFVSVNKFSMHALYRNRLIRAYLGASRYTRDPNRFTGFDPSDNVQMHELRPELLWATSFHDADAFIRKLLDARPGAEQPVWAKSVNVVKSSMRKLVAPDAAAENVPSSEVAKEEGNTSGEQQRLLLKLWSNIDWRTLEIADDAELRPDVVEAVVDQMNIVLDTCDLAKEPAANDGRPLAMRNRELLDQHFAKDIRPMPPVRATSGADAKEEARTGTRPPLHVVNMALNLVSGDKLAWQQRKAESFTCSPMHAGSPFLGYRAARGYGGEEGISLGTAVTISGAAASPNMGYHSSPALAFIMTLFNVRLGWWLGNPGPAGRATASLAEPGTTLDPMLREVIANTDDRSPYVYLSDGGHFENLGLYEMILRRCHYILVSDAGCDPNYVFEDLGNAIRKIRTDLGVRIELDEVESKMRPRPNNGDLPLGEYVALGTIHYKEVDGPSAENGKLIYVKPGVYRDASFPKDVYNYARESAEFPHESTADQFFSESQFESYRALGEHVIMGISKKSAAARIAGKIKPPASSPGSHLRSLADAIAVQP